jgi:hypothetical protein
MQLSGPQRTEAKERAVRAVRIAVDGACPPQAPSRGILVSGAASLPTTVFCFLG